MFKHVTPHTLSYHRVMIGGRKFFGSTNAIYVFNLLHDQVVRNLRGSLGEVFRL